MPGTDSAWGPGSHVEFMLGNDFVPVIRYTHAHCVENEIVPVCLSGGRATPVEADCQD